jgi:hypothetical protein
MKATASSKGIGDASLLPAVMYAHLDRCKFPTPKQFSENWCRTGRDERMKKPATNKVAGFSTPTREFW